MNPTLTVPSRTRTITPVSDDEKCTTVLVSGKNKGDRCSKKATKCSLCTMHHQKLYCKEKEINNNFAYKSELQPLIENSINDEEFWNGLIMLDINSLKNPIEYLLEQFGTKEHCNRFDVGNTIEFIIGDYIKYCGFKVLELPNAKRFDIDIDNYKKLSIKYSSTGDITLHNSNSSINKDIEMKDTILLTPEKLYLITNTELCKNNININDYTKNTGDSLKLKRKILKELEKKIILIFMM
jgi:hypothetical protein